jgi:multidrug efflux pump subunit AcrA (membrane-fusion protein)
VNGTFVYVPNGRYFFRTPVKVGRKTEETVEVLDGLYSGDEVVREPVTSLWLAELQALRGGVACADGH